MIFLVFNEVNFNVPFYEFQNQF